MRTKLAIVLLFLGYASAKQRTMTFKNLCNEPVWIGFAAGSVRNTHSTVDVQCGGDGDCYQGSHCITTGPIRQCFFDNPVPENGNYKLETGESRDVHIPIYDNGLDFIWSGAITGRTGCTSDSCKTADCGQGDGACKPSQGFMQPATQAEMTFAKSDQDYYDVEVINGFHIPVSMEATNVAGSGAYWCGNPGSKYPKTSVGSCSWEMEPPSYEYNWVTMGGSACSSASGCPSGQLCGISFNPGHADLLQRTCGTLLGYWSADEVCGINNNFGAPFNCLDRLGDPYTAFTNLNLYQCTGIGSCYQNGADPSCCGCANWDQEGLPVPGAPDTEQCKSSNVFWHERIKKTLFWLKKACPTAYTYPYDDMSSTFKCKNPDSDGVNMASYTITFCPNNETRESVFLA